MTEDFYGLLGLLGVNDDTLAVNDVEEFVRNCLICGVQLDFDPAAVCKMVVEDKGWGDPFEVSELVAVELGFWGKGRNGKMGLGFSFGVYEVVPLVSIPRKAFSLPPGPPAYSAAPLATGHRRAIERLRRVIRLSIVDADGEHTLEFDVGCPSLLPGQTTLELCGKENEWVSVIVGQGDHTFHAGWSGAEISKDWWNSFAWTTLSLQRCGIDHILWTGMDRVLC